MNPYYCTKYQASPFDACNLPRPFSLWCTNIKDGSWAAPSTEIAPNRNPHADMIHEWAETGRKVVHRPHNKAFEQTNWPTWNPSWEYRWADEQPKPVAGAVDENAAYEMGAKGAPATESERKLFEAWMRGHCWALGAEWDGTSYRDISEIAGQINPQAMRTRQLFAAWRDRAALASAQSAQDILHEARKTT
jgi:hypothetical protein